MGFINTLFVFLQDFLESLFTSSSPEYKKKHQLKQLDLALKALDPPLYRPEGFLLPAFAATLYQLYQFLQPIKETLNATIRNKDRRVAEKYRDYLLELLFTDEQRAQRKNFLFTERSAALAAQTALPERMIEEQGKQFSQFLKVLDSSDLKQAGALLQKLELLSDFTLFDFNNLFAYFDPAFKPHVGMDTTVSSPSFHQVEVVEVIPVLLDLYYVLARLDLGTPVIDVTAILEAKKNSKTLDEETKSRMHRIFQAIAFLLQKKLGKETLLAIIRITKEDADFQPDQPKTTTDYVQQYRARVTEFFHNDSRRLLKDRQENVITSLINTTFGNRQLETISGYSEETNGILQELTPFSLEWIKPLEIIRTFAVHYFEPHFRQILRSVIVEGYFTNRSQQTALASAFSYCETVTAKIAEFEQLFADNQPCSVKTMKNYLTELEKGMDFEKPLRKMVENMNGHAKQFIQQTVNQYTEVFNFCLVIVEDNKKTVPEFITNMRNLSISAKNNESYTWLEKEIGVFRNFLEIMKKYAIVGTLSISASLTAKTES